MVAVIAVVAVGVGVGEAWFIVEDWRFVLDLGKTFDDFFCSVFERG